jgi:hypothetical protein
MALQPTGAALAGLPDERTRVFPRITPWANTLGVTAYARIDAKFRAGPWK